MTLFQCLFGTICFGARWVIAGDNEVLSGPALGYVVYLGLVVTGGAYFAFNNAIQKLSGPVIGPFYAAVPVFTLVSSVIWNGEAVSLGIAPAIAFSIATIVLATGR